MSLKVRLVLTLTVALTMSFLIFGVVQYEVIHRSLMAEVDKTLALRGSAISSALKRYSENGEVTRHSVSHIYLNPPPLGEAFHTDLFVEIVTPQLGVITATDNLRGRILPILKGLPSEQYETIQKLENFGDHSIRLLTVPVSMGNREIALVVLGRSLQLVEASLARSVGLMIGAGLLTLALSICLTVVILSRGLSPLDRMARIAKDIVRTGDVSRRVPIPKITDEVGQVSEAFNALVARVQELLDGQRRLLADTSHELRNPLMVIRTDLDMLRKDLDADTRAEVVAEAEQEAMRMGRLVDALLLLTATELARQERFEPVRLDVLAQETVARFQPLAGTRDLAVSSEDPILVMGDMDRLRQILTNLLENAIRFTRPDGHIKVALELSGETATMAVQDDGVGISSEHLPRIFDRFYRVDAARSRASGGTGLGLSIAWALVQAHGGSLRAESEPGRGSRFLVTLHAEPLDSRRP